MTCTIKKVNILPETIAISSIEELEKNLYKIKTENGTALVLNYTELADVEDKDIEVLQYNNEYYIIEEAIQSDSVGPNGEGSYLLK